TDHDNLLHSIRTALGIVLSGMEPKRVRRLNLSTTLSTNSIVEGKTEDVGVIVSAGPGVDPENHRVGGHFYVIDGSIDHRGTEIKPLDQAQLEEALKACGTAGVRVYAAVGKFSTRNPGHEDKIEEGIRNAPLGADFITRGHCLSGVLSFPRRMATAYFNSAVWRSYNDFAWAVEESVADFGLASEINVLKADGGTMPLPASKDVPVQTILSGPAASVMGIISLCDITQDCVILDIGGTTTDIAVFADGAPLIENKGMTVGSYPTLVRALKLHSVGIGGDSALHVSVDDIQVGPDRKGPSMAGCEMSGGTSCEIAHGSGGSPSETQGRMCAPALTDAMNYLGVSDFGDTRASKAGIERLAGLWDMVPERMCRRAVAYAVDRIRAAVLDLVYEINEKPVYTIFELLEGKRVKPRKVYVMGGPAKAFSGLLSESLGLEVVVPEHFAVANAVGAALTRTTMDVGLFADTQKRRLFIPNLNVACEISRDYDLERAKGDARRYLLEYLRDRGTVVDEAEAEIIEAGSFNMVDGYNTKGRNIRVRCQVRPRVAKTSP
ncbi:MAG: hydantoinase/oxoprolinase family protein, partial [Thermodesulfobacteriota bacterium]|nr:hydantoinase/oxoprolinase family protein [Thermodesulfobacteriota bacterium]